MKLEWDERALDDLEGIHSFIARDSPRAADRVVDDIRQSAQRLTSWPRMGRAHPDGVLRELVVSRFPYVVVYEIVGEEVRVLAVFHQARQRP